VFGFVSYGWHGFTTLQDAPDRNGRDVTDFYLQEMSAAEKKAGRRLVDVLDIHWYPEAHGANRRVTEDDPAPEVAKARIQSTRSLWDPTYKESSWIANAAGGAIRLLPRMREKIEKHYPGTKLAITEYYFGGGVRITEASGAPDVAAARVQAPRSLWDPGYVETSWISQDAGVGAIRLLPRMREKIAAQYPGTRLAITEYNYGGGEHVSGAIAQADVLGIYGREQVFAGALWDLGGGGRFIDAAFAAYCNYDGALGHFGDTAVAAATSDVQASSVYASVDAGRDDRMVVVAINKSTGPTSADLVISHPVELTRGQSFQITAATPAVVRGPSVAPTARNSFRLELPASSVTTVVLER